MKKSIVQRIDLAEGIDTSNLFGHFDNHLRVIERGLDVNLFARGEEVVIEGEAAAVRQAGKVISDLSDLAREGVRLTPEDVEHAVRNTAQGAFESEPTVKELAAEAIVVANKKKILPKSPAQKEYVESMRRHDIVVAIGPAGTGKTYLGMAMGVSAFLAREVSRIILARPAVEAGEKLGFLPGDIAAKVNPYLRPLYDALYDMMEFERANRLMERGDIEIAPLAYMRGRAQPYFSRVLTPSGFWPIGSLAVGDLVIGSDGRPTQVLGVYPQGRKQIFRVRTQDGASTLCCAEHLWAVSTRDDRRRGKPPRVIEARQMLGQLREAHYRRFELPLISRPVEFEPRNVPMDPYALGLLLGDGCLTARTTPSFATADLELALALERDLGDIEVRAKGGVDYVLHHTAGGRGGVIVANPVTATLRDLGLAGSRSATKFVPESYLYNSSDVRLAVLQGLLDTDGGPVTQLGRSCRIQYSTMSSRLRDDVVFLIRSLGGVVYWRTRAAADMPPGLARGRPVHHRADAFVLDIRLPAGITPFRLPRKIEAYRGSGGGRPMRFIDGIEPAGEEETACIQVAASDSLYVTDDFLVTHNTLNDSFIILDEAQNATSEQMKMFLTRLGYHSKIVVTGDITQVDLPTERISGLIEIQAILDKVPGIRFAYFTEKDVVRHRLVQDIIKAYEKYEEKSGKRRR